MSVKSIPSLTEQLLKHLKDQISLWMNFLAYKLMEEELPTLWSHKQYQAFVRRVMAALPATLEKTVDGPDATRFVLAIQGESFMIDYDDWGITTVTYQDNDIARDILDKIRAISSEVDSSIS